MSDTSAFGFGQFVPGFDFLQNLSKTAAQAAPAAGAVPGVASWVAPTLSIEEIDKRIQELKAVQFWLDQNATALKATIQAMEVQKMTLSTLQSMNVNMADLAKAFTAKPPAPAAASEEAPAPTPAAAAKTSIFSSKPEPASAPMPEAEPASQPKPEVRAETASDKPAVDPMQWWGALTQQFQGIAAAAMKDVAGEAMKAGMANKAAAPAEPPARTKRPSKTTAKASAKAQPKAASKPAPAKVAKSAGKPAAPSAARSATRKRAAP